MIVEQQAEKMRVFTRRNFVHRVVQRSTRRDDNDDEVRGSLPCEVRRFA